MPLRGATTDENNRPPLDKGGLQGGGAWKFANLPPDPLLVQGGGTSFSEEEIDMRPIRFMIVFLICAYLFVTNSYPYTQDSQKGWTPDLAMMVKRVSSVRVSPNGLRVAYVVGSAVMEGEKSEWLSEIHVAHSDGKSSIQLTQGEKSSTSPEWSPDGNWIAFLSFRGVKTDPGTDPRNNLWRIRVDGGEAEQLTEEKGEINAFAWSPDGKQISYCMTDPKNVEEEKAAKEKRDWRVIDESPKVVRLYLVSVEKNGQGSRLVRNLTSQEFSINPNSIGWSPDGKNIVFSHTPTAKADDWTKADISILDVGTGKYQTMASTAAAETDPFFSPDGLWIAYSRSDIPPSWAQSGRVQIVSSRGGAPKSLGLTYDQKPKIVGWSADGKRVLVSETYRTASRVYALPVDGSAPIDLTPSDLIVESPALNASRTRMGFTSQSTEKPVEAFLSSLDRFEPIQISHVQNFPELSLGKTEIISWRSSDGKEIEGLLTYPNEYQPGMRAPLLVIVHGGPTGVFASSFTGSPSPYPVAAFAARGYAVLRCNVRGSSGYGRDFRYSNYRDWGGGDYRDILAGADALIEKGIADANRLGIMGWSYGGYMTSWVITQTKRFKAASVGAGVTNLMSFTGTADIPSFLPDYFGGEHWDILDLWRAHSAMFNVRGVSTPTLIQHGEADLRVPISQGYEFYNALKRQNVPVQMVVYPRQPHGLQEPKFLLDAMQRNLDWFDRWVKGTKIGREILSNSSQQR